MSALGQKQTCAVQLATSALPPKATSDAYFRMSAMSQKRTCSLFDQLVGAGGYGRGELEAQCFGSFGTARPLTGKCSASPSSGIPDLPIAKHVVMARSCGDSAVLGKATTEMHYNRRTFTAGVTSFVLCTTFLDPVHGQQVEHSSLKLGVANKAHLYYLPVTIAERRGHFRDYGLAIAMSDFEGGGQTFDALLAGSVDVAAGAYEHVLRAQAMGQDIRAVIELGRFPGVVLAVGKNQPFKSYADLKGLKIG